MSAFEGADWNSHLRNVRVAARCAEYTMVVYTNVERYACVRPAIRQEGFLVALFLGAISPEDLDDADAEFFFGALGST